LSFVVFLGRTSMRTRVLLAMALLTAGLVAVAAAPAEAGATST
jgi:hypothetical protein